MLPGQTCSQALDDAGQVTVEDPSDSSTWSRYASGQSDNKCDKACWDCKHVARKSHRSTACPFRPYVAGYGGALSSTVGTFGNQVAHGLHDKHTYACSVLQTRYTLAISSERGSETMRNDNNILEKLRADFPRPRDRRMDLQGISLSPKSGIEDGMHDFQGRIP
ncbi:hypothetical protein K461DRAFT_269144 [Myriangium duriaei CBS 260.36]|uniref:Uncharacterized protein n=1 Tax=Myriangium duriaei CBS 260.36 TaxID=1168546 RepID=A0A9P4J007_9PEZI|nr:hypothetical protein K461DRAFT_269144 [Myriangium duriaei CBS 260.36]